MPEETMERVERTLRDLERPTQHGELKRKLSEAYSVFSRINELPMEHRKPFVERLEEAAKAHKKMDETLALITAIERINHPSREAALERLSDKHPTPDGKNFANVALRRLQRLE